MKDNQVIISTFKPKVVEMHGREHLESFREAAEATGVGLHWTNWRFSIEVGSKIYLELVKKGEIPKEKVLKIMYEMGISETGEPVKVKREAEAKREGEDGWEELQQFMETAKRLGVKVVPPGSADFGEGEESLMASTSISTSTSTSTSTSSSSSSSSASSSSSSTSTSGSSSSTQRTFIDLSKEDYTPNFLSEGTMRVLKLSKEEVKRMSVGNQTRYVVAGDWRLEPASVLPKRIEMWEWLVACLKKGKEKGPYSYLCSHVTRYDVAGLFESLINSVDIQNPFIFWRAFEDFVVARPEKGEDVFAYFTRLEKLASGLSIREPEEVGIQDVKIVSELALKLKMLDSTSYFGEYKSFANKLRTRKPSKWLAYTRDGIIEELKTIHDNSTSMTRSTAANASQAMGQGRRERSFGGGERPGGRDGGRERAGDRGGRSRSRGPPQGGVRPRSKSVAPRGCPSDACWSFWETGKCTFESAERKCTFKHLKRAAQPDASKPNNQSARGADGGAGGGAPGKCSKCDGPHRFDKCTFQGECSYCKKVGHKAVTCRKKKTDEAKKRPGNQSRAHMGVTIHEPGDPVRVEAVDEDSDT